MTRTFVYKIFQPTEWTTFQTEKVYRGSPVDLSDGFIHLSCLHQLQGTLDKHYTGGGDVVIGEIKAASLGGDLKFEVSRGGEDFPHLYAPLDLTLIIQHWVLSPDDQGRYQVSDLSLTP